MTLEEQMKNIMRLFLKLVNEIYYSKNVESVYTFTVVVDQRQRYKVVYSKGHTTPMFYYYLFIFFLEALHMEEVVA